MPRCLARGTGAFSRLQVTNMSPKNAQVIPSTLHAEGTVVMARLLDGAINGRAIDRDGLALACRSLKIDPAKVVATLVADCMLEERADGGLYLGALARGLLLSAYLYA